MKVGASLTGIDCDSRHGSPPGDLLAAHRLEEEFGATCDPLVRSRRPAQVATGASRPFSGKASA